MNIVDDAYSVQPQTVACWH